jgi:hypothetical protein
MGTAAEKRVSETGRLADWPVDEWLKGAAAFYGPSVDLSRVTVRTSRLVLGPPGTAWTCNEVIRFKRPKAGEGAPTEAVLIHELGHVWEHQSGQAQLLRGIVEQIGRRLGRDPYDFGGPDGVRAATDLTRLLKESQARIIEEYWRAQHRYATDRRGVPFATDGYGDDLERLVRGAGIGVRSRSRRTVWSIIDGAVARVVNAVAGAIERLSG